ncbi:MAG: 7-carboxy-7-deazaguanine synthase QueE [Thermoleophilia bacterium]|nr:7-carboxy-7-deazaguanine synthase QueE [Thermoleophilia bacterium]
MSSGGSATDTATPRGSFVPPATTPGTLPVVELFHSIQGEGSRTGEPSTFIRLAGCNLRCTWCDTPYSWSSEGVKAAEHVRLDELADRVTERAVVLTGGEPMLHRRRLPALIAALRERGVEHVTVETNATIYDPALAHDVDLWSLSPKLPGSGEGADAEVIGQYLRGASDRVQLKFVVTEEQDLDAMWSLLEQVGEPLPASGVLVQPDGRREDYGQVLRVLAQQVLDDDGQWRGVPRRSLTRVMAQVHRVAWGAAARGV